MQELIAFIINEPVLLRLAVVLIWGTLILVALEWFGKKQRKWTSRTTEGTQQRLCARKIVIHEYYA